MELGGFTASSLRLGGLLVNWRSPFVDLVGEGIGTLNFWLREGLASMKFIKLIRFREIFCGMLGDSFSFWFGED